MSRQRKNYTPEEKVAILKRHLVEKVPVSQSYPFRRSLIKRRTYQIDLPALLPVRNLHGPPMSGTPRLTRRR